MSGDYLDEFTSELDDLRSKSGEAEPRPLGDTVAPALEWRRAGDTRNAAQSAEIARVNGMGAMVAVIGAGVVLTGALIAHLLVPEPTARPVPTSPRSATQRNERATPSITPIEAESPDTLRGDSSAG